jgi:hypothetical protein
MTAHMTYGYQMRPFTQVEVDAAEARLEVWHFSHPVSFCLNAVYQVWISSFQDEASRRDSLLMASCLLLRVSSVCAAFTLRCLRSASLPTNH